MRATALLALVLCVTACGNSTAPERNLIGERPAEPVNSWIDQRLAGCPTRAALERIADVRQTWAFESAPLVCRASEGSADLTASQVRAAWSLIYMKELRFDRPVPWTSKPLYDWFRDLVGAVAFRPVPGISYCCDPGNVIVIRYAAPVEPLTWPSVRGLIGVLIHEARHIEVGNHRCGNLDVRVSDMNAFGVHNLFMTWIAEHSDPAIVPVEYRAEAAYAACLQRNSAFCSEDDRPCGQ